MSLFDELKRRNVFRVALAYLVVGWLLTEVLTTILPTLGAPDWAARAVILIFAFGFLPAIVLSWFYELTAEGIKRDEEVRQDESTASRPGNALQLVTIAGAVILVLFLGFLARNRAQTTLCQQTPLSVMHRSQSFRSLICPAIRITSIFQTA